MSRLIRDRTADSVLETKFSGASGDREIFIFLDQLTMSRIGILCYKGLPYNISFASC